MALSRLWEKGNSSGVFCSEAAARRFLRVCGQQMKAYLPFEVTNGMFYATDGMLFVTAGATIQMTEECSS
jgi:hypothetical protein